MNKVELRNQLTTDIEQFLANGGVVVTQKAQKVKVRHPVTGHQKLFFGPKAPHRYPASSWSFIDMKK